ncbi:hypothetical protein [Dongshaea marina]|uniref:hypothetical protein n=1 Tax=Dongshaea marina TaxID=2047966 RepID=UPI000D3E6B24|nr:hypothetical protein [Dongshaea marina]
MELRIQGNDQEQLLFQLLGITKRNGDEPCGLLLGVNEATPDPSDIELYLRLPDLDHPLRETEQLTKELGRAIGLAEVHL